MNWLARADDWLAGRWPRLFGHRVAPLTVALLLMVVAVVCFVVGGSTWPRIGAGASGAAIAALVNGARRVYAHDEEQAVSRDRLRGPGEPSGMTDPASSILRGEGRRD